MSSLHPAIPTTYILWFLARSEIISVIYVMYKRMWQFRAYNLYALGVAVVTNSYLEPSAYVTTWSFVSLVYCIHLYIAGNIWQYNIQNTQ